LSDYEKIGYNCPVCGTALNGKRVTPPTFDKGEQQFRAECPEGDWSGTVWHDPEDEIRFEPPA
jgi:hypothetical protein